MQTNWNRTSTRTGRAHHSPKNHDELKLENFRPYVQRRAWPYAAKLGGLEEAEQIGFMGLCQARDKWNPELGAFATYAHWHVIEAIRLAVEAKQRQDGLAFQDRLHGRMHIRNGRNIPKKRARRSYAMVSGDQLMRIDGETTIFDQLASDTPNPEELLADKTEEQNNRARLAAALATLNDRERFVIERRYLGEDGAARLQEGYTCALEDLSQLLSISRERVRQIEVAALGKLRAALDPAYQPPKQRRNRTEGTQLSGEAVAA